MVKYECICLSVIVFNSASKSGKNYYPQIFLGCKYKIKEKTINALIANDVGISSDDSDGSDSEEDF